MKKTTSSPADIAIVGMGCLFPKANHLGAFWANIKHGIDAIIETPESHWRPEDYYDADPKRPDFTYGKRGGFLESVDFNPLAYGMPPNALEATDTAQLLGMVAAEHALRDAGIGPDTEFDRDRVSVILGVTGALELVIPLGARLGHPKWREAMADAGLDAATINDILERMSQHYVPWQESSFPGLLGNVVAGRITKHLNLGGTNCVVDAACASSLSAVHLAALELQAGKSDLVITGGVDTFNDIFMFMCFSKTPALSPTGNAKPFDANGDGTILGEGLGMVALKRLSDAERHNDRIYAVIKGIGSSSDGKGDAIYAPSAPGQVKALKRAYEQASFEPRTIELIEAHGTGTAKGDAVEISALSTVYGSAENGPWCAIGSVKSQIGHTKAAAGAAALIKAAMALYTKTLPPTIKVKEPLGPLQNPDTPFYVNTQLRPWLPRAEHLRRAGVSALGFGGSNFHCVLEEYQAAKTTPDWDGDVEVLAFSGANAAALISALSSFPVAEKWSVQRVVAKSLRDTFDVKAPCRLALVVRHGETDLPKLIAQAKSTLASKGDSASWSIPTGVYFGAGEAPGKLAFLFPGQGTQYPGMLRDLACQFPEFLEVLAHANAVYDAAPKAPRLTDRIYPHPAFTAEAEADHLKQLTATAVAPSAIGAVSAGTLRVVERFGIAPDAIAGHSYGEIVGLLASGKVSEADFHLLSKLRGALMGQGEGDKGTMMAVRAPEVRVMEIIESSGLKVIIANKNAPEQMVLAGGTEAMAQAESAFTSLGIQAKVLPVSAAFHSEYVSHVRDPFLEALKGMEIGAGTVTLYANTNAQPYPDDLEKVRVLVAEQLAKPVEFVKQIQRMHADGVRTFLEIGPGSRMSGLVDAILGEAPHHAVAVDGSNGKRNGIVDLARALAELIALGHGVDLARWNDGAPVDPESLKPKAKMTVPICGANYVTPREKKPKAAPRPVASSQAAPAVKTTMANTPQAPTAPAPVQYPSPQDAAMPTATLQATEHHLIALQRMQQQTADLHRQFLEGQQVALETFRALLSRQQGMASGQPAAAFAPAAAPTPAAPVDRTNRTDTTDAANNANQSYPSNPSYSKPAPSAVVPNTAAIEAALLATIAEKTGYPTEMLELGMSLDADLGIDSIKRVEILSGLKDRLPEAPEFGPDQLGTFQTLGDIVSYIATSSAPPKNQSYPSDQTGGTRATTTVGTAAIEAALLATIAEKTGYPTEMLELGMSLDADLGIDSIKRVEILSALKDRLPETPEFGPDQLSQFQTLGDIVDFIAANGSNQTDQSDPTDRSDKPGAAAESAPGDTLSIRAVVAAPTTLDANAPVAIPADGTLAIVTTGNPLGDAIATLLDDRGVAVKTSLWGDAPSTALPEKLAGLILVAPEGPIPQDLIENAFAWIQQAGARMKGSNAGLIATVTQLDGTFGTTSIQGDALAGGLAGLVKTAAHEWPAIAFKAIDVAPDAPSPENQVVDVLLQKSATEIGITAEGLVTLGLAPIENTGPTSAAIAPGDVVVVTGGARGVTADVALAMAKAWKPILILLGRSVPPVAEASWLASLHSEAEIRQALLARANGALKPKELREALEAILRNREALRNIEAMVAVGAQVAYHGTDIRDTQAVAKLFDEIRAAHGPIRGIVHGAGVLADRLIEDKTLEQFQQVYGTKVDGLNALLAGVGSDALKFIALFSSSTGRFGRKGQIDYAASNEILNKIAQREAKARPDCRVVSINWGPWAGGMVTADLAKLFKSEGVGLIGLRDGAEFLVNELSQPGPRPVELVVMGGEIPPFNVSPVAVATSVKTTSSAARTALEIDLSVDAFPFLKSHVLNGKAVLPVAMISEWFAHTALHTHPGLRFHGFDELRVFKGVTLDADEVQTLQLCAGDVQQSRGGAAIPVELRSHPEGGKEVLHAAALVHLTETLPTGESRIKARDLQAKVYNNGGLYEGGHLFHGPAFQGLSSVDGAGNDLIAALVGRAPAPKEWIVAPMRNTWLADPLILDSSFQMMILWSFRQYGVGSLPSFLREYRQFASRFQNDGARIVIQVTEHNKRKATADIEFVDPKTGALVARIGGYECTLGSFLNKAFQNNQLGAPGVPAGTDADP